MSLSDEALVARVVATGEQHAFATLVRRHQSSVRALLRRLTAGDDALADDLAQETFMRAYRNLDRFRGDAKLSSWLYRIAYNLFLSHARKKSSQEMALEEGQDARVAPDATSLARHDLNQAFGVLKPEERFALALTYGQDLDHQEAAAALGIPLGTLKTHVRRGKEKLRKRLGAWQNEGVA